MRWIAALFEARRPRLGRWAFLFAVSSVTGEGCREMVQELYRVMVRTGWKARSSRGESAFSEERSILLHLGHLRAAEVARDALSLDKVLPVPAARCLRIAPVTGATTVSECSRALSAEPFEVSRLEPRSGRSLYTIDTLEALAAGRQTAGSSSSPAPTRFGDSDVEELAELLPVTGSGARAAGVSHRGGRGSCRTGFRSGTRGAI
jgi:hypothetical protein